MTTQYCRCYCRDYGKCCHVILAFDMYRSRHGEPCPLENLAFADSQRPPCLVPREVA